MRHLLMVLAIVAPVATCLGQSGPVQQPVPLQQPPDAARTRPNSIMVFGGRMSTTDFTSSLLFNQNYTTHYNIGQQDWDNHIAGVDYERDLIGLARDLRVRAEVGIDDRFGRYAVCCLIPYPGDPKTYPDRTVFTHGHIHSAELWAGGKVRWEKLNVGPVDFEVAGTVGLSGVTRAIGRERGREIDDHGNAHLLGFVAPEVGVSLDHVPQFELLVRWMHRSGAGGTFGGIREGYNADVVGVRYAF
jgi:hypothetical protein